MNKRGYEFGFAWIFMILIGSAIIIIAIYATTQIVGTERTKIDTFRAKEIGTLLTPVETSLAQSKLAAIIVPQETRLFPNCTTNGNFGEQILSALVKSNIGDEWQPFPGVESTFHNKYIFSQQEIRAEKNFFVFTKPFKFPFKIADVTMIWPDTEKYCFVFDSTDGKKGEIKRELEDISPENVESVASISDCSENAKTICFSGNCNISISLTTGRITYQNGNSVNYIESLDNNDKFALLFAGIFSDEEIYNCHLERLAKRAGTLSDLYRLKSNYLTPKGCSSSPILPNALLQYRSSLSSSDFVNAKDEALDLQIKNGNLGCGLF